MRLDDFLERYWPGVSRPFLRRAIQEGAITVNALASKPWQKLREGDVVGLSLDDVTWPVAAPAPRAEPVVLARFEGLLVLDKPAGVHTVPDRAGRDPGIHGWLAERFPDEDFRVVHRLDHQTSGCLIVARGLEAARWFDREFREGRVEKRYAVLVEGVVHRDRFECRGALGPDRRRPGRVRVVAETDKRARPAHTVVEVRERFRAHTLLDAWPRTGRSHQIRAHLRDAGHPIVADRDYGSRPLELSRIKRGYKARRGVPEKPLLARMFLHAAAVRFRLPDSEEDWVRVEAPLPRDLEIVLAKLRRFAPAPRGREGGDFD